MVRLGWMAVADSLYRSLLIQTGPSSLPQELMLPSLRMLTAHTRLLHMVRGSRTGSPAVDFSPRERTRPGTRFHLATPVPLVCGRPLLPTPRGGSQPSRTSRVTPDKSRSSRTRLAVNTSLHTIRNPDHWSVTQTLLAASRNTIT